MTSGLRKIHRFAWLFIGIAGIIFLIFTIKDLNFYRSHSVLKDNEQVKVIMDKGQLILEVKTSLKSCSSVVYAVDSDGQKGEVLGQVQAEGLYRFELKKPINGVIIYDEIKENELIKLNF
jgi:hypothetical protein